MAVYLDYNATTPILPEVLEAMLPFLRDEFGNPSSGHALGQRAHAAVATARAHVAALIGAEPDEIVFTSGGTEASNIAIRGALCDGAKRPIVTSVLEHPATEEPCNLLAEQGHAVHRIGAQADGRIDLAAAMAAIRAGAGLVTLIHAQNETGVLQPVAEIAAAARENGALVHADAAQSAGKVAVDVDALGVDLLSIAGHKLYAQKGIGALYVRRGTPLQPVLRGAGQERGVRPGTENVAAIVALGEACRLAAHRLRDARHAPACKSVARASRTRGAGPDPGRPSDRAPAQHPQRAVSRRLRPRRARRLPRRDGLDRLGLSCGSRGSLRRVACARHCRGDGARRGAAVARHHHHDGRCRGGRRSAGKGVARGVARQRPQRAACYGCPSLSTSRATGVVLCAVARRGKASAVPATMPAAATIDISASVDSPVMP